MKTRKIIIMLNLWVLIHTALSNAATDTLKTGLSQALGITWLTLHQNSIIIDDFDEIQNTLSTNYIRLPESDDEIVGQRLSYMSGWDKTMAIWGGGIYHFKIKLIPVDSQQTRIDIATKIMKYESNTTYCIHPFSSTGKLESDLLLKIKENAVQLTTNQNTKHPEIFKLLEPTGAPSMIREINIKSNPEMTRSILNKILKDYHFNNKTFNKDSNIILVKYNLAEGELQEKFIKEELITPFGGWDKALSTWEDSYRCTICFKLSETYLGDSIRITLKSYYEQYESNTTEKWHRFKSTGVLENEILTNLKMAMKDASNIDKYDIANIHFNTVIKDPIEYPLPIVLLSTLKTIKKSKLKIAESTIDSALVLVTDYKKKDNSYYSFSILLQQTDLNKTKVEFSVSARPKNPSKGTSTILYEKSPADLFQDFIFDIKQQITKNETSLFNGNPALEDTANFNERGTLVIQNIIKNLKMFVKTSYIPELEIDPSWVEINSDTLKKSLTATILVTEPFETKYPLNNQRIINVLFEKFIEKLLFGLAYNFQQMININELQFRLLFKFHNLDDLTPINNAHRQCLVTLKTTDIIQYINFEINTQDLIMRSNIILDDEDFIISSTN